MAVSGGSGRLEYLDGLRGVAALSVVYFHYLQRWPAYYPYDAIRMSRLLTLASIGVWLFFVISGFVISLTLHRCATPYEFAVRRFARLWPAMLLCSLFTYLVLQIVPGNPFAVAARNFAPSLTFVDPVVFNVAFRTKSFDWMDGSYWSLFPEVQFYVLIACVYFLQPQRFARNLLVVASAIIATYSAAYGFGLEPLIRWLQVFPVSQYLPFFIIGVGFYELHVGGRAWGFFVLGALGLAAEAIVTDRPEGLAIATNVLCVLLLAWAGMRTRAGRRLLSHPWITTVGAASYSLYLIHQRVGVAAIHWLGRLTHAHGAVGLLLPAAVAVALTLLAIQIYRWWEAPLNRAIVGALSRTARDRVTATAARSSRAAGG
jgi:peptidoglycan/LPS O-acetylase OafA/YrhL